MGKYGATALPNRLHVMIDRAPPQTETLIPLSLGPGQSILGPGFEPVLGWYGCQSDHFSAQALIFPNELLEPRATHTIAYACVLPAPRSAAGGSAVPQVSRSLSGAIERQSEPAFLASSLPGGQVRIVLAGGIGGVAQFRWAFITAEASARTVWRCFVRVQGPLETGPWTAIAHDYVFEAGTGSLLTGPGSLEIGLGNSTPSLTHSGGRLVCFPSKLGRVKVTGICADGWSRRELKSLMLHPNGAIAAHFEDGAEAIVATAAPAHVEAGIAA